MDAVTHVLIAVAVGIATRQGRSDAWVPVAGAAALAPDLDVFVSPLGQIEALYWLSHRSASHSLVGAPIAATAFVWLLGRTGRRWHRLAVFKHWRAAWPALLIGAYSHLPLDILTHKGVPLWWPFTDVFVSMELFFWIVPWLAPISFIALLQRYRGTWDDRRLGQATVFVVAIIVVLAGIRVATKPFDEEAYPTPVPWDWIVVEEVDNGTLLVRQDERSTWYPDSRPQGSEAAVAALLDSRTYDAFRFQRAGPIAIDARPMDGGWALHATAVLEAFEREDAPDWLPQRFGERVYLDATFVDGTLRT